MIQVTVGNNVSRAKVTVDPNTTLRTVLEQNDINYASANMHLDGCALKPGDLDKSFAEMGITSSCYLLAVTKADNAN